MSSQRIGGLKLTLETCHDVLKMLKINDYNIEDEKMTLVIQKKNAIDTKKIDKRKNIP